MATTDDNKLRSIAAVLGVSSLALLGVTACDDGATEDPPAEDGVDDGVDDGVEEDPIEEDPADEEEGDL